MKRNDFRKFIETYEITSNMFRDLSKIGFDFYENNHFPLSEKVYSLFEQTILSHYNKEGFDWVEWFIFETDYGLKDMQAYDADKNRIAYDIDSLFDLLEKDYKNG